MFLDNGLKLTVYYLESFSKHSLMSQEFIPPSPLQTAVLLLVFNRLDTTQQVFQAIRKAKPPRLYIAADGARINKDGEVEKVLSIRDYIIQNIDWKCKVETLFREKNLGCKYAVSGAITWFFEKEEQGIILEDDCLPSQSFFWFCEELLNRYKDDERIYLISGYNKQDKWPNGEDSYFFSNYGGIWGWACWSRAWKSYDIEMASIKEFIKRGHFINLLGNTQGKIRQKMIYDSILIAKLDSWAYQWAYARHKNNGLACVPVKSLIENIGFGRDATHTFGVNTDNVYRHEISFPLVESKFIVPDRKYDELFFQADRMLSRIIAKLKRNFYKNNIS
jgi:hypothetical protein